jgi:hypothetical protein
MISTALKVHSNPLTWLKKIVQKQSPLRQTEVTKIKTALIYPEKMSLSNQQVIPYYKPLLTKLERFHHSSPTVAWGKDWESFYQRFAQKIQLNKVNNRRFFYSTLSKIQAPGAHRYLRSFLRQETSSELIQFLVGRLIHQFRLLAQGIPKNPLIDLRQPSTQDLSTILVSSDLKGLQKEIKRELNRLSQIQRIQALNSPEVSHFLQLKNLESISGMEWPQTINRLPQSLANTDSSLELQVSSMLWQKIWVSLLIIQIAFFCYRQKIAIKAG